MIRGLVLAVVGALVAFGAAAEENDDLDRIPQAAPGAAPAPAPPATPARGRVFLEDAATLSSLRGNLVVPFPPPAPENWQNRTSLDVANAWTLAPGLSATLGDRLNATEADGIPFPTHRNLRNDFREGFVTWEAAPQAYLEGGRINVRNGVALGFNPTDFFKTRTQIDQASLDPSVIRQDRLGTLMARGQAIWNGGSASIAVAPKVTSPDRLQGGGLASGFDPQFGRTNGADRFLATLNLDLFDLAPQALLYREGGVTRFGLNLSQPVGQSVVAYAEWSGGREGDLVNRAVAFGTRTGTLPAGATAPLASDASTAFRQDLSLGASWTSETRITLNLEYHYHQAGLSGSQWRQFFAGGGNPGELWFIRGFAVDQQEPATRQQAFLRADWTDAFTPGLELTGFAFVDLYDASTLAQLSASYAISNAWSVGGYLSANLGDKRSERGSLPTAASAIVQVVRYF